MEIAWLDNLASAGGLNRWDMTSTSRVNNDPGHFMPLPLLGTTNDTFATTKPLLGLAPLLAAAQPSVDTVVL
eukprot:scaffold512624_cov17-Prasinocladus_malaysianus.AAC.1